MRPLDSRLLRHSGAVRPYLAATAAVGVLTTAVVAVQAWLVADVVTAVFLHGAGLAAEQSRLGALAAAVVTRAALAGGQEWLSRRTSARVQADLRIRLLDKVFQLGPAWLAARRTTDVAILATRGIRALDAYFTQYLPQVILAVLVPVAVLACLLPADLVAFVTVAVTVPLVPVFMALVGLTTQERTQRQWATLQRLGHHFLDVVSGLSTLKVYGRARVQRAVVARTAEDYRRTTMGTLRLAFLSSLVLELLATLSVALVAVGIGLRLLRGELDLRTALFVLVLAPEAYLPLRRMGAAHHASAEGLEAARQLLDLVEGGPGGGPATSATTATPAAPAPPAVPVPMLPMRESSALQVLGLEVRRPGRAEPVLRDVDLDVPRGRFVVVTGPSGCGKSTLLETLLGFVRAEHGLVRVAPWAKFAYVPQRPYVLAGTVADNVRLGAPEASDDAVRRVLTTAGDLAAELPDGIATRVGEGGWGLSAGQVRRLAVARALLQAEAQAAAGASPILLLDEPTAGLDPATEARVLAGLLDRPDGQTLLVVSHRPAVIAAADVVVQPTRQVVAA